MSKTRIHKWQDRIKMSVNNGPMDRAKFGHCGNYGEVTDDWTRVTCLKCLKFKPTEEERS